MKLLDYSGIVKILFLSFLLLDFTAGLTQNWSTVQRLGGAGNENCQGLLLTAAGEVYVAGSFEGSLSFGDGSIESLGEADIFLAKYDAAGTPLWIKHGGGNLDEAITSIVEDREGNIICIGTYWLEASFDELTLSTISSPKAIFVLKYGPNGSLLWGKSIYGTTLKEATDIAVDTASNLFISGFFEDQLIFDDTTFVSAGESDLFVLKLDEEGERKWVYTEGYKGDTRAMTLALTNEEDIIIGGFYNDTTRLGSFQMAANTYDRDVFLARMTQEGEILWAKRAGGVHDDEIAGLAVDEQNLIYVTGYLVGVMNLSDEIAIQSGNGNSDFYLLKYSPEGEVLQARAMGGTQVQQTTDIQLLGDNILLSGFYFGVMTIDNITLNAPGIVSGFSGSYRKDNLQANWMTSIDGDQTVSVDQIYVDQDGGVWLAGTFSSMLDWQDGLESQGGFDLFVGPQPSVATPVKELSRLPTSGIKVYPNPAKTILFIETELKQYQVALLNNAGQLLHSGKNLTQINIQHLPRGMYTVMVNNADQHFFEKIILE